MPKKVKKRDMEQVEEMEFTCPKCGSHAFGTSTLDGKSEGLCHGYVEATQGDAAPGVKHFPGPAMTQCGFTWDRAEDSTVFQGTGRFRPAVETAQAVPREEAPAVDSVE